MPRIIAGDKAAWLELWTAVEPVLAAITGKRRVTSDLSERPEERDNIADGVMANLLEEDCGRLRAFLVWREEKGGTFRAWFTTVAWNYALNYTKHHPEYLGPRDDEGAPSNTQGRWARLEPPDSQHPGAGAEVPEGRVSISEVLACAGHLLERDQLQVVDLWAMGFNHAEIAKRLGLPDAPTAKKIQRAAVQRLRTHYAVEGDEWEGDE